MSESRENQPALLQELENLRRWKAAEQARSQRRLFLDRVRDAAWRMRKQQDLEEFLMIVRDSLRAMGVPFHACT